MATPAPPPAFQVQSSRHFAAFLAAQRTSLAFSTYQSGKLFLVGLKPTGELSIFERTFNRCMGLWADGQTLWMSTAWQLWRCENALAPGEADNGFDRLYVPLTVARQENSVLTKTTRPSASTATSCTSTSPVVYPVRGT